MARGRECEERFANACRAAGKEVLMAPADVDMNDHVDMWVNGKAVDVKAKRSDGYIWIEFINVNGKVGWLFGHADFFAFELTSVDGFAIISAEELRRLAFASVSSGKIVDTPQEAEGRLYRRRGRADVLTKIDEKNLMTPKIHLLLWGK